MKNLRAGEMRDVTYQREYAAWVEKMTPDERANAARLDKNLLRPKGNGASKRVAVKKPNGGMAGDFADAIGEGVAEVEIEEIEIDVTMEDRRFDELMALVPRGMAGDVARQFVRNIIAAEKKELASASNGAGSDKFNVSSQISPAVWRAMLYEVKSAKQPRLRARVLLMALGWAPETESMRAVGRDYVLSPEQVSNMVEDDQRKYNLPKNQFNKSAEVTAKYKETNGK